MVKPMPKAKKFALFKNIHNYYVNVANYSKNDTVKHFEQQGYTKYLIYRAMKESDEVLEKSGVALSSVSKQRKKCPTGEMLQALPHQILKLTNWYPDASARKIGAFLNVCYITVIRTQNKLMRTGKISKSELNARRMKRPSNKPVLRMDTQDLDDNEEDAKLRNDFAEFLSRKIERAKSTPRPRKKVTATKENLHRFLELLKMDPTVSYTEASVALGLTRATLFNLMRMIRKDNLLAQSQSKELEPNTHVEGEGPSTSIAPVSNGEAGGGAKGMPCDAFLDLLDSANDNDQDFMEGMDSMPSPDSNVEAETDTSSPPKIKSKLNTPVGEDSRCLICFERFGSKIESDSNAWGIPSIPPSIYHRPSSGEINDNLNVIFLLTKVFQISTAELTSFLEDSDGMNPWEWIILCDKCQSHVKEAIEIQVGIQDLKRRLEDCRRRIWEEMEESLEKQKGLRNMWRMKEFRVTKRLRELAGKKLKIAKLSKTASNYPDPKVGDQLAESMIKVKVEPLSETEKESDEEGADFDYKDSHDIPDWKPSCNSEAGQRENRLVTAPNSHLVLEDEGSPQTSSSSSTMVNTNHEMIEPDPQVPLPLPPLMLPIVNPQPQLIVCDECGEEMRFGALPLHKLREHGDTLEGYDALKCEVEGCKYVTIYPIHFKKHQISHKSVHEFPCQFCGRRFKTQRYLKTHEDIHKNASTKPYQCDICGASYAVKTYLYWHYGDAHKIKFSTQSHYNKRSLHSISSSETIEGSEGDCSIRETH